MSATGRSSDRPDLDFARTPGWAVHAVLPYIGEPGAVVDLGCGDGAIGVELRSWLGGRRLNMIGVELDAPRAALARATGAYDQVVTGDALDEAHATSGEDLVIANPPFALAADFYRVATSMVRRGGLIAFLLRANWMVPATREGLPLPDLHFLRRRPSFRKSAKGNSSDSTDYAWHCWRHGDPLHGGHWTILECEPARAPRST